METGKIKVFLLDDHQVVRRGLNRIGVADIADLDIPDGAAAFLCGPLPFMRTMREQLLAKGVAAADIHYEVFGPDLWLATA